MPIIYRGIRLFTSDRSRHLWAFVYYCAVVRKIYAKQCSEYISGHAMPNKRSCRGTVCLSRQKIKKSIANYYRSRLAMLLTQTLDPPPVYFDYELSGDKITIFCLFISTTKPLLSPAFFLCNPPGSITRSSTEAAAAAINSP